MCERLLRLRPYFNVLAGQPLAWNGYLSELQWKVIEELVTILLPFHQTQELLEGQKYVSISLIPYMISTLRTKLTAYIQAGALDGTRHLATLMLYDFNDRWGSGIGDTVFKDNATRVKQRRQKGIAKNIHLGAALDPRTKKLEATPEPSQVLIWAELTARVLTVPAAAVLPPPPPAAAPARVFHPILAGFVAAPAAAAPQPHQPAQLTPLQQAAQEVARYRAEPAQDLFDPADGRFYNPLEWWSANEDRFPRLAVLARMILCIPATSAPSERVFSQAGLTISNARAGLLPDNAAACIFLHGNMHLDEPEVIDVDAV
jgi:hypothetical protein